MQFIYPWVMTIEIIVFIVLVVLVEIDWFGSATMLLIATIVAAQYFNLFSLWSWLKHNYLMTIAYVLGYLVFGVFVWSFAKWYMFLHNFKRAREEAIKEFLANRGKDAPPATPEEIRKNLGYWKYKKTSLLKIPSARDYKGKIIAWMCWWPLSMIGTLLNDPIRKFFNWIYLRLSGCYQQMANKVVPELEK